MFGDYDKFYQNVFANSSNAGNRAGRAGRLQQPQRPQEPVQPDRPGLGKPAGGHRPDAAARFRARPRDGRATSATTGSFLGRQHGAGLAIRRSMPTPSSRRSRATPNNRVKATVAALYVQDQIRPADWLEIVAGLRFDSFKLDVDDFRAVGGGEFEPARSSVVAAPRTDPQAGRQSVALRQLQPLLSAAVGRPVQRPDRRHRRAEARAVRQLRGRREVGGARRPARDRRHLPARPHQHPRDRSRTTRPGPC